MTASEFQKSNLEALAREKARGELPVHFIALLADLVRAYQREVNPADDWTQTAMTKDDFDEVTKEYRAAKEWLSANGRHELPQREQP